MVTDLAAQSENFVNSVSLNQPPSVSDSVGMNQYVYESMARLDFDLNP